MALQSSRTAYESRIAERCEAIDLKPGVEGGAVVIDIVYVVRANLRHQGQGLRGTGNVAGLFIHLSEERPTLGRAVGIIEAGLKRQVRKMACLQGPG